MAKKKSITKYAGFAAILLALASIGFMFAPAIVYGSGDDPTTYTLFQAMFGYNETITIVGNITANVKYFDFSFMNLLTLILLAAGIIFSVLKILSGKNAKLFTLITTACFIVAGVFLFMVVPYAIASTNDVTIGGINLAKYSLSKDKMTLGWGAIVSAICALIAGACKLGEFLLG